MTNKKAIRVLENIEHYITTHTNESCEEEHTALDLAIKALEERPKGKWIESQEEFEDAFIIFKHECSNCKQITFGGGNFCPNCGARMESDV